MPSDSLDMLSSAAHPSLDRYSPAIRDPAAVRDPAGNFLRIEQA